MVTVTQSMSGCRIASSILVTTFLKGSLLAPGYSGTIAVGASLHPVPGIGDHGGELRLRGRPAELRSDLLARGYQHRWIPGSSRGFCALERAPCYLVAGWPSRLIRLILIGPLVQGFGWGL